MQDYNNHINWAKQALQFIRLAGNLTGYEQWDEIVQRGIKHVKYLSGADRVLFIKHEDEITARVIEQGTEEEDARYTDPELVSVFDKNQQPLYFQQAEMDFEPELSKLFRPAASLVIIPVKQVDVVSYILLTWKEKFDFCEDFKEFINACCDKINDTVKLTRTYYSLDELKVLFDAILQTVPQSIVFVDDSGNDSWLNDHAAKLFGMDGGHVIPAQLAGAMQQLRSKASNKDDIFKRGMELFRSADKTVKDWRWIFTDPQPLVLNVCCTPTVSDHISGMLWTFDDITHQYQNDQHLKDLNVQLEEKSRLANAQNMAKSEFLANMSHEIRTPMNGVMGMTSLLRNSSLTEEQFDFVESIRISADSLLEIINEILDFSKIESGKLELEEHPFFINKIIEETYDLLALKADDKGLDLLYVIDPEVPTEVIGDMTRVRQIVVNLVGNAIKFTPHGEILTSIRLVSKMDDLYKIEFSVKDTGIGIPQDKMHKLFNSFSQVDSSTTRKYGGTGLGLAISARLVEKMHGRIWVESEENVGTTFKFTIQLRANVRVKEFKPSTIERELLGKSIMIIDDNLTNLNILKGHCEQWGMHADIFTNGPDGIKSMVKHHYDIVILDMQMPGMNGIEVAKQIVNVFGKGIPLVLFSSIGHFSPEHKKDLGIFAVVLDKPIKQAYFQKMLIEKLSEASGHRKEAGNAPPALQEIAQDNDVSILVAEDNVINQKIVIKAFKNIGYSCDVVSNGLEVLSSLKRQHYDVVLMDVQMPEMDGLQATRKIIEDYADKRPVIIAMTAGAYEKDKEACIEAGMDDYIIKPFDFDNFYTKFHFWKEKILNKKG